MRSNLLSSGLAENTTNKIQQVFSHYPQVMRVILYGSRAKGNYHKGSDIDLSIVDHAPAFSDLLKLENELDDLMLPYNIDLCLYQNIKNEDLMAHIQAVGIEFYHQASQDIEQSLKQLDKGESILMQDVIKNTKSKYER